MEHAVVELVYKFDEHLYIYYIKQVWGKGPYGEKKFFELLI